MNARFPIAWWAVAVILVGLTMSCQRNASPPLDGQLNEQVLAPWFADVTEEAGVNFVHDAGSVGSFFLPQIMGSGVAVFDFNNDGLLDIYLVQNGGPNGATNKLFQQIAGGKFKDVSAGSGLDIAGYGMGVAVGDVNNDGFLDVLVTGYGGVHLFLNNGNGTFTDVTEESGLRNLAWGTSAAFLDFDRDGWLDLVVVNYIDYDPTWPCNSTSDKPDYCGPGEFPGQVTKLFRNCRQRQPTRSRSVAFEDVSVASGLASRPGPGLGVVCADFDGDGWPDIFVANDGAANHLWINRHNGTFTEEGIERGLAYNAQGRPQAGMGIALADTRLNGLFDVFVTHLAKEYNTLWGQGPQGLFQDYTVASGLGRVQWRGTGFGVILGDFDQDGVPDLAVVNGAIVKRAAISNAALGPHWGLYAERNQLFANEGTGHFRDVSLQQPAFCGTPNVGRGLACGDLNNDGALDLVVTTVGGRARVYRNVVPNRGHWLLIRAIDPALKRDAYGAEVRVRAGNRSWRGWISPGGSYLSSSDPRAHFGLGSADHVDNIEILWPDGTAEVFPGRNADQRIELFKGGGLQIRGDSHHQKGKDPPR